MFLSGVFPSLETIIFSREDEMMTLPKRKTLYGMLLCSLLFPAIWMCFLFRPPVVAAEIKDRLADCAKIDNDAVRLQCFDELAGRKNNVQKDVRAATGTMTAAKEAIPEPDKLSVMTKLWDLDKENRKQSFTLRPYRPNYFLPVAYNTSPNGDTALDIDSRANAQNNEAKFQLSFKMKIWEDLFNKDIDLWLAYTQLSFWQLYNSAFSSPFRETNYEPEFLVNFRTGYELFGFKGRFFNIGLNHQSNGRSRPLSRGWNRVVANLGWEKNHFNLLLKTWYRISEDKADDDNPDISRYMGYGELWGTYYWNRQRFTAMFRNNLRSGDNVGAIQLDWSFPLPFFKGDRFKGYIQYFNGYGESLLDYNTSINRISVGFMLTDWN
jgi:phospholipase A1/A2